MINKTNLFQAARNFGVAIAKNSLELDNLREAIAVWLEDENPVSVQALRIDLFHAGRDAGMNWGIQARAVERQIRSAVRPLFRVGASKAAIEEAAGSALREPLDWNDVYPILRDEQAQRRTR